jgi:para-nitrobenzyl esterase
MHPRSAVPRSSTGRPTFPLASSSPSLRLALAAVAVWLGASARAAGDPHVTVTGGTLEGSALSGTPGAVFRGIPFAQPPVGELRWRAPRPRAPWNGVRAATEAGPPAAQAAAGWNDAMAAASSEDCLYLDVWTPALKPDAPLPVMVWIHGGANTAGAGGFDPVYAGTHLITRGVVLVVIQYRLGLFGFLAHPELTAESPHNVSGNYAILDQIAALQWVRDNIGRFGGDPGNVTIFGQSAGSMDVIALMSTPLSRGLFHRAIAESGAPGPQMSVPLAEAEKRGAEIAGKLAAPATGAIAALRARPAKELLAAGQNTSALTVDGWVFPEATTTLWAEGREHAVPLIIGTAAIEFPAGGTPDGIRQMIRSMLGGEASRAVALYGLDRDPLPPPDPLYGDIAEQWGSDLFRCPAILHGENHARAGHAVWQYQFDRAIPPQPKVGHSGDLPYVFGNFDLKSGNLVGQYGSADRELSDAIQTYWTNFAKTGNPNGVGAPEWPRFDAGSRRYVEFTTDAKIVTAANQRGAYCDLFRPRFTRAAK